MIISDTKSTKEKVKTAPVKKGTDLFYWTYFCNVNDANCYITDVQSLVVSKEKAKPEPSKKGKIMTIVFIVQHAIENDWILYRGRSEGRRREVKTSNS